MIFSGDFRLLSEWSLILAMLDRVEIELDRNFLI